MVLVILPDGSTGCVETSKVEPSGKLRAVVDSLEVGVPVAGVEKILAPHIVAKGFTIPLGSGFYSIYYPINGDLELDIRVQNGA